MMSEIKNRWDYHASFVQIADGLWIPHSDFVSKSDNSRKAILQFLWDIYKYLIVIIRIR